MIIFHQSKRQIMKKKHYWFLGKAKTIKRRQYSYKLLLNIESTYYLFKSLLYHVPVTMFLLPPELKRRSQLKSTQHTLELPSIRLNLKHYPQCSSFEFVCFWHYWYRPHVPFSFLRFSNAQWNCALQPATALSGAVLDPEWTSVFFFYFYITAIQYRY